MFELGAPISFQYLWIKTFAQNTLMMCKGIYMVTQDNCNQGSRKPPLMMACRSGSGALQSSVHQLLGGTRWVLLASMVCGCVNCISHTNSSWIYWLFFVNHWLQSGIHNLDMFFCNKPPELQWISSWRTHVGPTWPKCLVKLTARSNALNRMLTHLNFNLYHWDFDTWVFWEPVAGSFFTVFLTISHCFEACRLWISSRTSLVSGKRRWGAHGLMWPHWQSYATCFHLYN